MVQSGPWRGWGGLRGAAALAEPGAFWPLGGSVGAVNVRVEPHVRISPTKFVVFLSPGTLAFKHVQHGSEETETMICCQQQVPPSSSWGSISSILWCPVEKLAHVLAVKSQPRLIWGWQVEGSLGVVVPVLLVDHGAQLLPQPFEISVSVNLVQGSPTGDFHRS